MTSAVCQIRIWPKFAVEVLKRRFAAVLPIATRRLNVIYIPVGLILTALVAAPAGQQPDV